MRVHNQWRARKRARKYIVAILKGKNKKQAMLEAGYKPTTAHNPSLLETSKTYNIVLREVLDNNMLLLQLVNDNILEGVRNGELEGLDMDTRTKILQRITDSHTKLTPKVTVKQEETGLDGVKRTLWSEKQA